MVFQAYLLFLISKRLFFSCTSFKVSISFLVFKTYQIYICLTRRLKISRHKSSYQQFMQFQIDFFVEHFKSSKGTTTIQWVWNTFVLLSEHCNDSKERLHLAYSLGNMLRPTCKYCQFYGSLPAFLRHTSVNISSARIWSPSVIYIKCKEKR